MSGDGDARGDMRLLHGGNDRDQMAEGPSMSCRKEHNANLTSERQPFLIPKISVSRQPLEVGFLPQATACPTQTSTTTRTTSALRSVPTHPKVVLGCRGRRGSSKGPLRSVISWQLSHYLPGASSTHQAFSGWGPIFLEPDSHSSWESQG